MADVFVSYVSEDRAIAEKISRGLEGAGFSVWWDRHIHGGVGFRKEIDRQLGAAKAVVVLWSAASLDSEWVCDEAQQALDEKKLIPLRLDGVQPPLGFRQAQALDFAGWKGDAEGGVFPRLVESVRHFVGDGASIPSGQSATSNEPSRSHWSASRRRLAVGGTVLVAGTAALLIVWPYLGSKPTLDGNDGRIEIAAFETLTTSDELERFAKTIAPTMVHVLTTSGVKTIAPGRDGGVEGSESGAEFVLHGRVDREGDDLVVSADVLNRRDALVLWSITQKRTAAQPAVLQEQFSVAVASTLGCALDARKLNGDPSTDLFAQELRLCEAYAFGAIEQTPELARRIVETAPQYASSYWGQALANAIVSTTRTLRGDRPPAEIARLRKVVYDSARVAAEMDPRFDPLLARAIVVDPAVDLAQREKYLRQSLEGEYLKSLSFAMQACLLETVGRIREARIAFERAANENPLDANARLRAAILAAWLGSIAIARHEFDEMRKKTPDFGVDFSQWWTESWFGDGAIPKALYDRIKEQGARVFVCPDLAALFADARAENARPSEEELGRACVAPGHGWLEFAYFGYVEAAFRGLEADPRLRPIDSIHYSSAYKDLFLPHMWIVRADARFMPLAARLGLVDYWLDTDQWPDFCKEEKLPYDCKEAALAARAAVTK